MTSRRDFLTGSVAGVAAAVAGSGAAMPAAAQPAGASGRVTPGFKYCLNTSTVRGQKLTVMQQLKLAGKVGYEAIEPWLGDIDHPEKSGGSLKDIARAVSDAGLAIPSAIGFAQWAHDDDAARAKGMEQMKREMGIIKEIGGTRIAACAAGVNRGPKLELDVLAERYRAVCELGRTVGVVPELELWGPSVNLSKLSECLYIAAAAGHEDACLLLDVYHLHKGGNDPAGLNLLGPSAMHVMHMNDYPTTPARDTITDADRILPGEGAAPYQRIFPTLLRNGLSVYLSLELFNKKLWEEDAESVMKRGLAMMKDAVQKATAA